jgi:3-hydroxybutyryl-CoA dehydrogenase
MKAADIRHIAVVGAGVMGHGIAQDFATHGYETQLWARSDEGLRQAMATIERNLLMLQQVGQVTRDDASSTLSRIHTGTILAAAVAHADVVIEAVSEDLPLKQRVFRDLDTVCPDHTILASTTSSLLPSLLASVTQRPDKVLVAHYINPPYLIPLVEIVRAPQTSDDTVATLCALLSQLGKRPAVVQKELPGFVVNRLQIALGREAFSLVEQGFASPQDIDTMIRYSFGRRLPAIGLFESADLNGLDVVLAVVEQLLPEIESSREVPPSLRARVSRGELGVKTGKGFYTWTPESVANLKQRMGQALTAMAHWS